MTLLAGVGRFVGGGVSQQPPMYGPGLTVPKNEGNVVDDGRERDQSRLGEDYQGLLQEDKDAVFSFLREVIGEYDTTYRIHIQKRRLSREYFNGNMAVAWDESSLAYLPVGSGAVQALQDGDEGVDLSEPIYTWNFYRTTGIAEIAVLSGGPPTVRWNPRNASDEMDVATAAGASDVCELFDRVNNIEALLGDLDRFLYTDGVCFAYVRHVKDAQRFGTHQEPQFGPIPQQLPGQIACGGCGWRTQAQEPPPPGAAQPCPQCGQPLTAANFKPPQTIMTQGVVGYTDEPNGAEIVDLYGALEVRAQAESKHLRYSGWLTLELERDIAELCALYPAVAEKLRGMAGSAQAASLPESRLARVAVTAGGWQAMTSDGVIELPKKATLTCTWIRPWMFERLNDEKQREYFKRMFPNGAMFAFVGNVFCEARAESIDDYWVAIHAAPGDGMIRPALGDTLLDPQDAYNDLSDAMMSAARASVPALIVDKEAWSATSLGNARGRPTGIYEVETKGNKDINSTWGQMQAATMPPAVDAMRNEIAGPTWEKLSGVTAALQGQSDPNLKTAKAYAQAREQGMGYFGPTWRLIKQGWVEVCTLAVQHFIKNHDQNDEVAFAKKNAQGGYENTTIRLASMQGQAVAYAESDEAYPVSVADRRLVIHQLMEDPDLKGVLMDPENFDEWKGLMGASKIILPGERARKKQLREIKELLASAPVPMQDPFGMPMVDPMTGEPQVRSTIPVKPITDEHQFEFRACQNWLNSSEGLDAEKANPNGFANVMAHAKEHWAILNPPMPMAPPGAPGAAPGPSGAPGPGAPPDQQLGPPGGPA